MLLWYRLNYAVCILLAVLVLVAFAVPARAGMNANHKVAVHVLQHEARACSKNFPVISSCEDIVTTYDGCGDVDIFPVFYGLNGVTAVEFGLDWPVEWGTCAFVRCVGLNNIGTIVNPGDWTSIAWAECEHADPVIIGYGWLMAVTPGLICPIPSGASGTIGTADCNFMEDMALDWYCSGACGETGEDPCQTYLPPFMEKTADLDCAHAGDSMTYTISYTNNSNPDIHNAVLIDYLPAEAAFVSASPGGTYDGGSHSVSWSIGTVPNGGTGLEEIVVQVSEDVTPATEIENTCEMTSDEAPTGHADLTTLVCPDEYAPLGIVKDDLLEGDCVEAGEGISYYMEFDNYDNIFWVYNLVITDSLPPEVVFVSADREGVYDPVGHTITWNFPQLKPGGLSAVTAEVTVEPGTAEGTPITNRCEILSDETPPGRTTEMTLVCTGLRPLSLNKVSNIEDCVDPGGSVEYTITYANSSYNPEAQNVVLRDRLNSKVIFTSATGGGVYDSDTHEITWALGNLAPGAGGSVGAEVAVRPGTVPGLMRNDCFITCDNLPEAEFKQYTTVCGTGGANPYNKLVLHVLPHMERACTSEFPYIEACEDIVYTYEGCGDFDFFPVIYDLAAYQSVSHGLTWPEDWGSCSYVPCAGNSTLGMIAYPGDGMVYAWSECQHAPIQVLGYGWLTAASPGLLCFCPDEVGQLGTGDCDYVYDPAVATFCAGICGVPGDDPCPPMRTVPATWGSIKAMFK